MQRQSDFEQYKNETEERMKAEMEKHEKNMDELTSQMRNKNPGAHQMQPVIQFTIPCPVM